MARPLPPRGSRAVRVSVWWQRRLGRRQGIEPRGGALRAAPGSTAGTAACDRMETQHWRAAQPPLTGSVHELHSESVGMGPAKAGRHARIRLKPTPPKSTPPGFTPSREWWRCDTTRPFAPGPPRTRRWARSRGAPSPCGCRPASRARRPRGSRRRSARQSAPTSSRIVSNSWFSEMRPPVATLITSPLAPGASHARSTPSTTLAT